MLALGMDSSLFWGRKRSYPTEGVGNCSGGNRCSLTIVFLPDWALSVLKVGFLWAW